MSFALLKKEWRAAAVSLLLFCGLLTMYIVVIIAMFDPALGEGLNAMMAAMPELFSAFGMASPGVTMLDFLINYLYGFLLQVLPMVFILMQACRLVARYVDRGSMAFLLATPLGRRRVAATQAAALLGPVLAMALYVTVLTILAGQLFFPDALDISAFLQVNLGMVGLWVFLAGVGYFFSCLCNTVKYAAGFSAGLCMGAFLIQMLSQADASLDWLRFCTPLSLFDAAGIAAGQSGAWWGVALLYAMGALLFAAGVLAFCRRDIPV